MLLLVFKNLFHILPSAKPLRFRLPSARRSPSPKKSALFFVCGFSLRSASSSSLIAFFRFNASGLFCLRPPSFLPFNALFAAAKQRRFYRIALSTSWLPHRPARGPRTCPVAPAFVGGILAISASKFSKIEMPMGYSELLGL